MPEKNFHCDVQKYLAERLLTRDVVSEKVSYPQSLREDSSPRQTFLTLFLVKDKRRNSGETHWLDTNVISIKICP